MSAHDRKVLKEVSDDWMRGAGGSVSIVAVIEMLTKLEKIHGDDFSIEKARDALNMLADDARMIRRNLKEKQREMPDINEVNRPKIWKTIRLGTGLKTADDFCDAIRSAGGQIRGIVKAIMNKPAFTVSSTEREIDLALVSVAELGFKAKDSIMLKNIYQRALALGLELCPPEVGPQLFLQYRDQPMGGWLIIGMEPIEYGSVGGRFSILDVLSGRWLRTNSGGPNSLWCGDDLWVFVLPRDEKE